MIRISFFIPYPEMREMVQSILEEATSSQKEIVYDIQQAQSGEVLEIDESKADVVIARGFTVAYMKTTVPKIELSITAFDMLRAVHQCMRQYDCHKIALIGTESMVFGIHEIEELLENGSVQGRLLGYTEHLDSKLDEIIKEMQAEGIEAVIGGRSVMESAKRNGIPAVLLCSGRESTYQAVEEAITAIQFARAEKRKRKYLQTIMDYSFEGILSVDPHGTILTVNKYAIEKLKNGFSRSIENAAQVIGQNIFAVMPQLQLDGKNPSKSQIVRFERAQFMVNCVSMKEASVSGEWLITFRDVENIRKDEGKIRKQLHDKGLTAKYHFENVICSSLEMKEAIRTAEKYAGTQLNVFVHGETGTGKELFAQSIHNASTRCSGPFVAINCAAFPDALLESELFGYEEGAFTGATKGGKVGLIELAHNGTLFLDEVGDMAINLQARLLRVVQEGEIRRIGGDQFIPVNVRIIAAANKDMRIAVQEGSFRQDLLYRIDVLRLEIPPLRKRGADILKLAEHFIQSARERNGSILQYLNAEAQQWMLKETWEGNVRELRNFCERLSVLCEKETADMTDIRNAVGQCKYEEAYACEKPEKGNSEKERILEALQKCEYIRKNAAAMLEIDTSTLWRKMKKYGIDRK